MGTDESRLPHCHVNDDQTILGRNVAMPESVNVPTECKVNVTLVIVIEDSTRASRWTMCIKETEAISEVMISRRASKQ